MAWYYVKNGGTATGDGGRVTTQRTGAWSGTASEYYDEIVDAVAATTVPGDGDFILCSDLHNKTTGAVGPTLNTNGAAGGEGLQVISVDDANQENYKPGAKETYTLPSNHDFNGLFAGVSLESSGGQAVLVDPGTRTWRFFDCTVIANATNAAFVLNTDGCLIGLVNVDIDALGVRVLNGGSLRWLGGTWVRDAAIFDLFGVGGGSNMYMEGVDLSIRNGTLISGALSAAVVTIELVKCRLHASVTLPADTDLTLPQHRFIMRACDDSTGGDTFRFHYQTGTGKAVNNESVFVTANKAWGETSKKSSVEITTKANCSHILPFVFDLPLAQTYIDLADTASDVLRIPVTTTLTLTDTEIAAFLMYPDGTTGVQANWVTSGKTVGTGNYGVAPLGAGTTLPTSTTAWTAAKTNKYHLELDTSGDAGQAQAVGVRIEVYRASIAANTLMLATEFEVS